MHPFSLVISLHAVVTVKSRKNVTSTLMTGISGRRVVRWFKSTGEISRFCVRKVRSAALHEV
jgi:hypothetical protein